MKTSVFVILTTLCVSGCNAQDNSVDKKTENKPQPKTEWSVSKEYDENGNIIRYDSTYTWSYTNVDAENVSVNPDSVINAFNQYFGQQFPAFFRNDFQHSMMNDSLLYHDFLMEDYFLNRWENDFYDIENIMEKMDSIRNSFFQEMYPQLKEPETKKQ